MGLFIIYFILFFLFLFIYLYIYLFIFMMINLFLHIMLLCNFFLLKKETFCRKKFLWVDLFIYPIKKKAFYEVVVPLICRSFRLMMKWYSVKSTVAKSNDVKMIRHGFSPPDERFDTVILKLLLIIMDVVLSLMNGKS